MWAVSQYGHDLEPHHLRLDHNILDVRTGHLNRVVLNLILGVLRSVNIHAGHTSP